MNCKNGTLFLLFIILTSLLSCKAEHEWPARPRIAFFYQQLENRKNPDYHFFFNRFYDVIKYSAKNLNMEVRVFNSPLDPVSLADIIKKCVIDYNPHAFLLVGGFRASSEIIKLGEKYRIPSFTVNSTFNAHSNVNRSEAEKDMGKPRGRYAYWIGELLPRDEEAAFLLAQLLARGREKINMTAYIGSFTVPASQERIKGLMRAVKNSKKISLNQVFTTNRYCTKASKKKFFYTIKSRYPGTDTVWCDSDSIALGVLEQIKELNLKPGKDIYIGSIDWSEEAFQAVEKGHLDVNVGGHFLDGAWAMVLLYDYLNGKDFLHQGVQFKSEPMIAVTRENVRFYKNKFSQASLKKLNFKMFSRVYNPSLSKYNFSIRKLIGDKHE